MFTGALTSQFVNGTAVPGTGYDFADFLLGLAQQTSVQYGYDRYYFRGNSWDLYVQDEWRARGNLTFNIGLRYEYVSPFSESNNRIVNLDTNSTFTAVAPVLPGQVGPVSGMVYPITLVNPDRNNFAPRVGVAWKAAKNTVVRAGYGINYNTAAYQNIVQNMAFQPPFSNTSTNLASPSNILTLQNGFPTTTAVTNNYGIDPNYGLGYVQIWNLDIQQEITRTLIVNLDYTGTKGTRLDVLTAPNSTANGVLVPGVQPYYYEASEGDSTANAGSVRVRKRLSQGVSLGGTFTWSKSLDNASTIGAGSSIVSANGKITGVTVVAQNAFDLSAERGLSSFNQEFRFTGDYLWELPFGKGRKWLATCRIGAESSRRLAMERRLDDCIRTSVHAAHSGFVLQRQQRRERHAARRRHRSQPVSDSESQHRSVVQYRGICHSADGTVRRCPSQQHYRPGRGAVRHGHDEAHSAEGDAIAGAAASRRPTYSITRSTRRSIRC